MTIMWLKYLMMVEWLDEEKKYISVRERGKETRWRIHTFVNDYFNSWLVKYENRNHSLSMEIWESDLTENRDRYTKKYSTEPADFGREH